MGKQLEKFCDFAVKILSGIFLVILCLWVATNGYQYPTDYSGEYLLENGGSLVRYLILAFAILLLTGLLVQGMLHRTEEKEQKKIVTILAIILLSLNTFLLIYWIQIAQIEPDRDAAQVLYMAQDFLHGNYQSMNYAYLRGYQHQCGLILLEEMILHLVGDYRIFQYINVIFVIGIQFLLYRICHELFQNYVVDVYCLLGTVAFVPLQLYVNLVYGDVCSLFLATLAFWMLLLWRKNRKWQYVIVAVTAMIIATLARKNTLIFLVALVITLAVDTASQWNWRPVGIAIVMTVCVLSVVNSIPGIYEKRSGIDMGDAMPAMLWVSMGLHAMGRRHVRLADSDLQFFE